MDQQRIELRTHVPFPASDVWEWHTRTGAFERLTPPWRAVEVVQGRPGVIPDDCKTLRLRSGPLSATWKLRHTLVEPGHGFVDEQIDGPFASWRHEHWFEPEGADACTLVDRIVYRLPAGRLGMTVAGAQVRDELERLLRYRHLRLTHDLARHADRHGPLRIAVSGASGLVGRQLAAFLTTGGHQVARLVRRDARGEDEIAWDPVAGMIDSAALEGFDAVIHLAGAGIADHRWSAGRMREIRESRVSSTTLLAQTLARLERPPKVLVSASAVGFYGDRGGELLTEDAVPGSGFLSEVCQAWELAAEPARQAGIRVVHPRFGVVVSSQGGVLGRTLPIFKAGIGGRIGSGDQWLAWIAVDDLLAILLRAATDDMLVGPVNAVAPLPVTNREWTASLAAALRRPAILPAPAAALRLAFGCMADEVLLASQRAIPVQLERAGFRFTFPTLGDTFNVELGCREDSPAVPDALAWSTAFGPS
jgi:uncharacterized protein (TIGR01777 family)